MTTVVSSNYSILDVWFANKGTIENYLGTANLNYIHIQFGNVFYMVLKAFTAN